MLNIRINNKIIIIILGILLQILFINAKTIKYNENITSFWKHTQTLKGKINGCTSCSPTSSSPEADELGWSTAINQYNTIISGAPGFSTDSIYYEGYIVIYEQNSTGLWNKVFDQIGLQNLDGHDMNHLGYSVDIDGYTAVAGAGYPGGWKDGYVSIFEHSIHGWSEVKKFFGNKDERFGRSVSISGNTIAIGGKQIIRIIQKISSNWIITQNISLSYTGEFDLKLNNEWMVILHNTWNELNYLKIYKYINSNWELDQSILPSYDAYRVDISNNVIVITTQEGIIIYEYSGGYWSETGLFEHPKYGNTGLLRKYQSVSIKDDRIITGTWSQLGYVMVYEKNNNVWNMVTPQERILEWENIQYILDSTGPLDAMIFPNRRRNNIKFAHSLALADDIIVIGEPSDYRYSPSEIHIYKLTSELPSFNNDVITNNFTTTPTIDTTMAITTNAPKNIVNISNTSTKSNFASFAVRYTPSYILIVITSLLWLIY